jgi:hypothetical protein
VKEKLRAAEAKLLSAYDDIGRLTLDLADSKRYLKRAELINGIAVGYIPEGELNDYHNDLPQRQP